MRSTVQFHLASIGLTADVSATAVARKPGVYPAAWSGRGGDAFRRHASPSGMREGTDGRRRAVGVGRLEAGELDSEDRIAGVGGTDPGP